MPKSSNLFDVGCWLVGWLVGCGLTSHSAIFQLYSDWADVQFPNLDLLPGTKCHGQLAVFSVSSLPRIETGTGTSKDVFYFLAIRGPPRGEGMTGNKTRIVRSTVHPATSTPQICLTSCVQALLIFNDFTGNLYWITTKVNVARDKLQFCQRLFLERKW